jgi:hypothetical protein
MLPRFVRCVVIGSCGDRKQLRIGHFLEALAVDADVEALGWPAMPLLPLIGVQSGGSSARHTGHCSFAR